jgi:undecaprenyl diphosphate synthase
VAFDYGSRAEILHAVRAMIAAGTDPADVDEARLRAHLHAPEMPDPDLVIRTSGEMRMSNFLLWQSAYAEFEFTTTLWPDFGGADLEAALRAYAGRQRRFGRR